MPLTTPSDAIRRHSSDGEAIMRHQRGSLMSPLNPDDIRMEWEATGGIQVRWATSGIGMNNREVQCIKTLARLTRAGVG